MALISTVCIEGTGVESSLSPMAWWSGENQGHVQKTENRTATEIKMEKHSNAFGKYSYVNSKSVMFI